MSSLYGTLKSGLIRLLEMLVIIIMGVLVVDVIWQVFTRFVMNSPSSWTEELAIMLLIWVSLLGASVGFQRFSHLGVDYFANKLSSRSRVINDFAVFLLIAFFAGYVMVYGGYRIVSMTLLFEQRSAALGIKMGYVYLALPISGLFIVMFSVENAILKFREMAGRSQSK